MTRLWLVRTGKFGQHEQEALDAGRAVPGFEDVPDLRGKGDRAAIQAVLSATLPNLKPKAILNYAAQLNMFVNTMQPGDLIIMPRKSVPQIAIGRIEGAYGFEPPVRHFRPVTWLRKDVPRSSFKQDLLYSFGAFSTICEITRAGAVARVTAMLKGGDDPGPVQPGPPGAKSPPGGGPAPDPVAEDEPVDLPTLARDQIRAHVASSFAGHAFTSLVAAILEAEGYRCAQAPPGPDGGIDIVAGMGPLGFDRPRIVVQVKSGNVVADHPTLQALIGNVSQQHADFGLLVSWSGFKNSVEKQEIANYFKVRLWDADDVLDAIFRVYDRLPEEIRKDLPLKRTWTLVLDEDESG